MSFYSLGKGYLESLLFGGVVCVIGIQCGL
jgi:hypothetical protein